MLTESERRFEGLVVLSSFLEKQINSFQDNLDFPVANPGVSINELHVENFHKVTALALSLKRIGRAIPSWITTVEIQRERAKQKVMLSNDVIAAINIDEAYSDFLFQIDEVEKAIEIARHITDGYQVPTSDELEREESKFNIAKQMRAIQFPKKKYRQIVEIAYQCVKKGDLLKASEIMEGIDLAIHGRLYLRGLITHYTSRYNFWGLTELLEKLNVIRTELSKDYSQNRVHLKEVDVLIENANRAIEEIGRNDFVKPNQDEKRLPELTIHTIYEWVEHFVFSVNIGSSKRAKELFTLIIVFLHEKTTKMPDEDIVEGNEKSEIGSLTFRQRKTREISNYSAVDYLITMADAITGKGEFKDEMQIILNGDSFRKIPGLNHRLQLVKKESRTFFYRLLLEILAKNRDDEKVKELYKMICKQFPDYANTFTLSYANAIYHFNRKKAWDIVLECNEPEQRAAGISDLIQLDIESSGFSDWEAKTQQLIELENEILASQRIQDNLMLGGLKVAIQLFAQISSGTMTIHFNKHPDQEDGFTRLSPNLLIALSRHSLLKGEWVHFEKLFTHPFFPNEMKPRVLAMVVDWLVDGKEIPDVF